MLQIFRCFHSFSELFHYVQLFKYFVYPICVWHLHRVVKIPAYFWPIFLLFQLFLVCGHRWWLVNLFLCPWVCTIYHERFNFLCFSRTLSYLFVEKMSLIVDFSPKFFVSNCLFWHLSLPDGLLVNPRIALSFLGSFRCCD